VPSDPGYDAALERYFLVTNLHTRAQAAAMLIRQTYMNPAVDPAE
jgi:hypothetical protein